MSKEYPSVRLQKEISIRQWRVHGVGKTYHKLVGIGQSES